MDLAPPVSPRPTKLVPRVLAAADRFQRGHPPVAFAYGVIKKFGDDQGGSLAAVLTYYGFLSLLPLLLVLVTVLGMVAGGSSHLTHSIEHSALSQFPIIGNDLTKNIHALKENSPVSLAVGLVALLWGSLGSSQAAQTATAQIWNVPHEERPGFVTRLWRSLVLVTVLGVFLAASTALSGLATSGGSAAGLWRVGGGVGSVVVNVGLFLAVFWILTTAGVGWKTLVPGAVVGGVAWTALQVLGTSLVEHQLRHANAVYGFFGTVVGLLWWMYLAMRLTLYSAEINVVRHRRLWPRSLTPPATEADERLEARR